MVLKKQKPEQNAWDNEKTTTTKRNRKDLQWKWNLPQSVHLSKAAEPCFFLQLLLSYFVCISRNFTFHNILSQVDHWDTERLLITCTGDDDTLCCSYAMTIMRCFLFTVCRALNNSWHFVDAHSFFVFHSNWLQLWWLLLLFYFICYPSFRPDLMCTQQSTFYTICIVVESL